MELPRRIPVVLCIDVEPDARLVDLREPSPWQGFPLTHELLQPFRERVVSTGAQPPHYSWFLRMDPQIQRAYGAVSWVAQSHAAVFRAAVQAGDAIGLHVHSWRWDEAEKTWVADYSSAAWIDECLNVSFDAFREAFGRECTTFRFGDRWMDHRTMERLAARGVEVDLTLEPGFDEASFYGRSETARGALPDYRPVPARPYRPSRTDYRVPDAHAHLGLWELPVTTAPVQPGLLHRTFGKIATGRPATTFSTALASLAPAVFRRVVDDALARPNPYLVLTLRTGAACSSRYAARIRTNLSALASHREASRFAWVTPAEAIRILQ